MNTTPFRSEATKFETKEAAQRHIDTFKKDPRFMNEFVMRPLKAVAPADFDYENEGSRWEAPTQWAIQVGLLENGQVCGFKFL